MSRAKTTMLFRMLLILMMMISGLHGWYLLGVAFSSAIAASAIQQLISEYKK